MDICSTALWIPPNSLSATISTPSLQPISRKYYNVKPCYQLLSLLPSVTKCISNSMISWLMVVCELSTSYTVHCNAICPGVHLAIWQRSNCCASDFKFNCSVRVLNQCCSENLPPPIKTVMQQESALLCYRPSFM